LGAPQNVHPSPSRRNAAPQQWGTPNYDDSMRWGLLLKPLPELLSAGILLALWLEPLRFGIEWFRAGVLTMLLEFFVIHASGFMAVLVHDPETSREKRSLQVAGLAAFYLLFMSAFAWGFNAWWMLVAFAWLCFGKLQAIWTSGEPLERDRTIAIVAWALSVVVYLPSVAASVIPDVPQLGVTAAVRDAAGFDANGGAWEEDPQRALFAGVLYFTIMALSRPFFALAQRPSGHLSKR
jgi:hypothetical protein